MEQNRLIDQKDEYRRVIQHFVALATVQDREIKMKKEKEFDKTNVWKESCTTVQKRQKVEPPKKQ